MKIVKYPDPFLFKAVKEVVNFDEKLKLEAEEMIQIMRQNHGVGLAANQVGLDKQIFVMQCKDETSLYIFVNPEIIELSEEKATQEEGCLSFPELYFELNRSKKVKMKWKDVLGNEKEKEFEGLEAICVQHETDHLKGIVFINHLKPAKKQLVMSKYMRKKK